MNDLSIYFSPLLEDEVNYQGEQIGQIIISNFGEFPEIASKSIALFSVPEYRGNLNYKNNDSQTDFRNKLKQLSRSKNWNSKIYDLGTIIPGEELKDTYFAISSVVHE
ncbi:MAG: hypothetical protein L7U23_03470, partial [Crocinitomicaceae bacterium]|nr:hypothetical protein [Crocinitomicaceae bacterium]